MADVVVGGAVGVVTGVVVGGAVVVLGSASGASVTGDTMEYDRSLDSP